MNKRKSTILLITALCLGGAALLLYLLPWQISKNAFKQKTFEGIFLYGLCAVAVICLLIRLKVRLFSKPSGWLALLIGLIIAVDNFPFYSYFQGNIHFLSSDFTDFFLFAIYCLAVGVFEECIFRGIVFSVFAERLPQNKKGFLLTYLFSSIAFGLAHLFNLFVGAGIGPTLLQVVYTTLTGGLFAFVLIKTKNLLLCGFTHGVYNFCGLVLSEQFLGTGIVFDTGTTVIMAIVSVAVGIFVLYKVFTYPEKERIDLYERLAIK